jgi:hypothetical protein
MAETIRMRIDTDPIVAELIKVFRRLPLEARRRVRDANATIAQDETDRVIDAADNAGPQAALAGSAVRVRRGESPAIAAGGNLTIRAGRRGGRVTGSDVFFGSEFGGQARDTTQQFPVHRGTQGYWFWPTLREDTPQMVSEWATILDDLANVWERG